MEISFENQTYNRFIDKIGNNGNTFRLKLYKILLPITICWLPLAIITGINGDFWTGNIKDSFITNFDSQVRFLICLPILILSEELISARLGLILGQFKNSGIVSKKDYNAFDKILSRGGRFLQSKWTILMIILFCYIQVFAVLSYESEFTSVLTWQVKDLSNGLELNAAGWWNALVSRPIVFFLFLQWLVRIIVWGWILRKISLLDLVLFPVHPDLSGGMGFIGYALRFFSPIAFAVSATLAGNMADFILIEGLSIKSLAFPGLAYFVFITLLFTLPLFSFTRKLIEGREKSVFENYDFANGMYRELRTKLLKGYDLVQEEDLKLPDFSAASDLSAVMENSLNMKYIPFTFRDLIPLWTMAILPFIAIILMEIPISELFKVLMALLV